MGTKELKRQKMHTGLNLILVIALAVMLLPTLADTVNAAIADGDVAGLYSAIASANNSDHLTLNDLTVTSGSVINDGICKTGKVKLVPISASAVHHSWQLPRIRNANGTSSNWSGYAVYPDPPSSPGKKNGKKFSSTQMFSDVTGSWDVPSVVASTSANTYSSAWLGLDGYSDNTVEQIGTEQDWTPNGAVYYAWVELYPKFAYKLDGFPVSAYDVISASVTFGGPGKGSFTLTITNETENVSISVTQSSPSAKRLSAEWIVEAPWSGGVLPLADFGTVSFSDCFATMNGQTGTISNGPWLYDDIIMETPDGTIKAEPSALSNGGTDFSVNWFVE